MRLEERSIKIQPFFVVNDFLCVSVKLSCHCLPLVTQFIVTSSSQSHSTTAGLSKAIE